MQITIKKVAYWLSNSSWIKLTKGKKPPQGSKKHIIEVKCKKIPDEDLTDMAFRF